MKALGQYPLARAVETHHADQKTSCELLGEGDVVSARRPDGRRVAAIPQADAMRAPAVSPHHVKLLRSFPVRLENDLAPVGGIARACVERPATGQLTGLAAAHVHFRDG